MLAPSQPLTFEDVTEIYRKEQKTKNVTDIRKDFYPALRDLIDRLRRESEKETAVDQYSTKATILGNQIKKVCEKAVQIFDFRAEKIMLSALRSASGASVDVERLTSEEKDLFDRILASTKECRSMVLEIEKRGREDLRRPPSPAPAKTDEAPAEGQADYGPSGARAPEAGLPSPSLVEAEAEEVPDEAPTIKPPSQVAEAGMPGEHLILRILEDIPPFAGPTRNYRLKKEDVISLPTSIARALLQKGMAVELRPSTRP
ncbi:MAG: hypothetical protein FJ151_01420 [Euryarchaeota archaeon]|nr:hypothetical protein [Euryarchaeota archaeon]